MFSPKKLLGVILVLIAAGAAAFAVWKNMQGPAVEVAPVQAGPFEHSIVVSGRVQAPNRIEIGSVITGRVEAVLVEEGAVVTAGQKLILLETSELRAALDQARTAEASARARVATVRELNLPQSNDAALQAEAQVRFAEEEYRRNRDLRNKGFISDARLQDLERLLAVAKSQLESARTQAKAQGPSGVAAREAVLREQEARAARELAESKLAQTTIRASMPGTVLARAVEPGDIVSPGKRLLTVNSNSETRLTAQIDEKNLPYLKSGQEALASSEAFPERSFKAVLYYISPGIDTTRGSVEARFRVPDPPDYLRADMTVSIDIGAGRKARALTLPSEAVRESGAAHTVQVVRDGSARSVKVEIGIRSGSRYEITSGVAEGDLVVLTRGIDDGARVRAQVRR
ncbi:MAG: efflux RND transporter periplasmic adaptor subunit [Proteobacteria bacterium]|nr:efflux RND transporter periplasmic adaptor subunit [Pseudomonadota bacterium]